MGMEIAADVLAIRTLMANICLIGPPDAGDGEWVLVDAGIPYSTGIILRAVRQRFGREVRPAAIVLTHGHFDHVGALKQLAARWDVPVYAHELELPHLTGQEDYPMPDPSVGGGLMARLSPLYPRTALDLGKRVRPLPRGHRGRQGGEVPHLPGWRWLHTPGHTDGHVSFFREADRLLIAGDAFTTVRQESALAVLSQRPEIHGPPMYFTTDWDAAERSVRKLQALKPAVAVTGHGVPMSGELLTRGLLLLSQNFDRMAVPDHGIYVDPAEG
ncbi:MAG TPA: MBL fold metallo-hydrolase [Symbiobacteriaceae bacterium]|jgi:glyoxylase-like metal-dependent hydrolase (beta-lactamase superfamily II)|nr:MBL fold metallo-hydrolase [Symbiobacteriaceae bacterium]